MSTIDDQIRCVEREIAMRKAVYPNRVRNLKMTQDKADHEIALMQAVKESLVQLRSGSLSGLFPPEPFQPPTHNPPR